MANSAAFINTNFPNCGVYQYGRRLYKNIENINYKINYYEVDTLEDFENLRLQEKLLIFNYIQTGANGPMPWMNNDFISKLRQSGKICAQIYHSFDPLDFDYFLHQNPNIPENNHTFSLLRPLPPFVAPKIKNFIPRIGSFGLGFKTKNFPRIIELVNQQFERATVVFNMINAHFGDRDGQMCRSAIEECRNVPLKEGINLEISDQFLSDEDLLLFLSSNDINVFPYNYSGGSGISSVIDFAIASERPIGIGTSNLFAHIYSDDICIDKRSIPEIIAFGNRHILEMKERYSQTNLAAKFENILKTIFNA